MVDINNIAALALHKATSQLVTRSCRHTVNSSLVNSSHKHLVTQSTRHKRAHNKVTSRNFFYLHAGQIAPKNSAQHGRRTYSKRAISKSPTTAKLLNGTNVRSKRTVNLSQHRETRRSTRHTILRCDELTM